MDWEWFWYWIIFAVAAVGMTVTLIWLYRPKKQEVKYRVFKQHGMWYLMRGELVVTRGNWEHCIRVIKYDLYIRDNK